MTNQFVVLTLYKFVSLVDYSTLASELLEYCIQQEIKGTFLIAEEGINGTVAGSHAAIENLIQYLQKDDRFADLEYKKSDAFQPPFEKMRVKLKPEIVKLGVPGIDPRQKVGTYVQPKDWNQLISAPDILLIDARNNYEYELGTFAGAIDPQTDNFRDFPQYVEKHLDPTQHKKIAMFCTGGIRCEKASAYLLEQGFAEVYHLKGGILNYLEEIPVEESLWQGDCFIFDNRIALNHDLESGDYVVCQRCDEVVSHENQYSEYFEEGVSCPKCIE